MRGNTAWGLSGLGVLALAIGLACYNPVASQKTPEAGNEVSTRHASSLDLGKPFDTHLQQEFLKQLTADERVRLIELRSRFALASQDCPLPKSEATQVFYVKFRNPLDADFAGQLLQAGASFVGYAYPNTHFLRARDSESLGRIESVLSEAPNVAGTLLRADMDACSPLLWPTLEAEGLDTADYRLLFWGDVDPANAQQWLDQLGAEVVEAARTPEGKLNLEAVRFLDARLTPAQVRAAVASPLVEWVDFKPVLSNRNVNSATLIKAGAGDVGPATGYNLTGEGLVVGVWDGGVARDTHVAFQSATSPSPFAPFFPGVTGRVLLAPTIASQQPGWGIPDTSAMGSHPCHVTGTVVSDGTGNAAARGFAPEAFAVSLGWGSMEVERQIIRHYFRHVADNHSYGNSGGGTGGYDGSAQASDIDIRDIFLNMCKSAGNSGSGDNTCTDDTCMKNALVIGAASDTGNIAGFSSRGPTDDGRLLPHFMANGVSLTSTLPNSDSSFGGPEWSGTSMSSPSVCGAVTLLSELWHREMNSRFLAPDVLRALLAVTTVERGNPGPDYQYGWGQLDIKRAADLILEHKNNQRRHIVRGQIRQGAVLEYPLTVTSSATPLKVALSWLDIYSSTGSGTKLINDLDMELIEPNGTTTHFPWSGLTSSGSQTTQFVRTGANRRDNMEVCEVSNPAIGTWKVRVRGFNIPALPQPTVLNNVVGFVLASERPILHTQEVIEDPLNAATPVNIPDNNAAGVSRTFNFTSAGTVAAIRVYLDIRHPRRGDVNVFLVAPDNTTVQLESSDTSTRRDLIGVYPDTRQYDDDVTALLGKTVAGTWTVRVNDISSGPSGASILPGVIRYLAVEIDANSGGSTNNPPMADAGTPQTVNEGAPVTLNGSASFDLDGDLLSFTWSQTAGPTATLVGANTAMPTFTAPLVGSNQVCTFLLTVDDGKGGVDTDTVSVTVMDNGAPNNPPTADAGNDFAVTSGQIANLDATASFDPDGDPLGFTWAQLAGPTVTLAAATTATPSFTAPTVATPTMITMQVTVDDGRGGMASDTVTVTVNPAVVNNPPSANAGSDRNVKYGAAVTLDAGGSSDPDGNTLTFLWTQIGGTTQISLNNATTATPSFTAPSVDDVLVFQVLVDDGNGDQDVDSVTVTVTANGGQSGGKGGGSDDGEKGCAIGDHQYDRVWVLILLIAGAVLATRRVRWARQ